MSEETKTARRAHRFAEREDVVKDAPRGPNRVRARGEGVHRLLSRGLSVTA
jgi:hypothetical protein